MSHVKNTSQDLDCVILDDGCDGAPSMKIFKFVTGSFYKDEPKVLHNKTHTCVSHGVYNICKRSSPAGDVVGHGHAAAFVFGLHSRRKKLFDCLAHMVEMELQVFTGEPPDELRSHCKGVLRFTTFRHRATVRPAASGGDVDEEMSSQLLQAAAALVIRYLNGDLVGQDSALLQWLLVQGLRRL